VAQERIVPILDTDDDVEYNKDLQQLFDDYQSESPDYYNISQEI
jgi:hypothetical protein